MDFNLNEERSMLQDMLRRFLSEKCDHETRRQMRENGAAFNPAILAELTELGIIGALFSEECGGFGGAGFDISVVFEEFGRAGALYPILGNAVLAGGLIATLANEQQQKLVGEIIAGTKIVAFAHTEQNGRYDLSYVSVSAKENDDYTLLNGTKMHVMHGAEADYLVVSARESGAVRDEEGISLFLVPVDTAGVSVSGFMNIDGTASATVTLDNVRLDNGARLGVREGTFPAIEKAVARATLALCAEAVGAMERAKDLTVSYLKERKQFGVAIGKFQALQHRTADMLIEIEQARSAVINLAGYIEAPRDQREFYVSAAKNLIGRAGALVAEECVQMHGGIGMTDEYELSHFARRLVMIDHLFGDVDHHLERFIALNSA